MRVFDDVIESMKEEGRHACTRGGTVMKAISKNNRRKLMTNRGEDLNQYCPFAIGY